MSTTTTLAAPSTLAAQLAKVGLSAQLVIQRADGQPLSANDLAAASAIVTCHDLESGRTVSDDEAAAAAARVLGLETSGAPLAPTGTGGE